MKNGDCYDKAMADLAPVWERFVGSAKQVVVGTVLNVLLVAVPMALLSNHFHAGNVGPLSYLNMCECCNRHTCWTSFLL